MRDRAPYIVSKARPVISPWSSAAAFDGWKVEVLVESLDPPPVRKPNTWLIRVGWRRRGLIDPAEIPREKTTTH